MRASTNLHIRWTAALAVVLGAAPALGQIRGRIDRVALTGGGVVAVRGGSWTTIDLTLSNEGAALFEGSVRLEQRDRDGDVETSVTNVVLLPNQTRPYRIYFVAATLGEGELCRIGVYDAAGRLVSVTGPDNQPARFLESNPITLIRPGEIVILEAVDNPSTPRLVRPDMLQWSANVAEGRELRAIRVEIVALPDRWHGLAFADALVMDDLDYSRLEADQQQAIVDWVRAGGRLLLSAARNWQSLRDGPLSEALPVKLTGTAQADRSTLWRRLVPGDADAADAVVGDSMTYCTMEALWEVSAGVLALPSQRGRDALMFRRALGRGTVTFVGTAIRDLFGLKRARPTAPDVDDAARGDGDDFSDDGPDEIRRNALRNVLRMALTLPNPPRAGEQTAFDVARPFAEVARQIAFNQRAGLYVLFSLLFAGVYWGAATLGTWIWLRRRQWTHHAWNAFAVLAVASSALGLLAVSGLRGVVQRVHDVQVVDAWS
ncbi:MAG: hypothetical protein V3T70_10670, partial [Phycisphaerae bacterium]